MPFQSLPKGRGSNVDEEVDALRLVGAEWALRRPGPGQRPAACASLRSRSRWALVSHPPRVVLDERSARSTDEAIPAQLESAELYRTRDDHRVVPHSVEESVSPGERDRFCHADAAAGPVKAVGRGCR